MLIGYARTSSLAQGLEAQERELRAAGCDKIFSEQVSSVAQREQLGAALNYVRDGDTRLKEEGVRPSEIASRLGIGRTSVFRVPGDQTARDQVAA
jgi:DNA invertase Pin-like site-specific DNA recombinase